MPTESERPDRPDRPAHEEEGDYPAGAEVPAEPAGVGENVEDADQPGLSEDPPQAD